MRKKNLCKLGLLSLICLLCIVFALAVSADDVIPDDAIPDDTAATDVITSAGIYISDGAYLPESSVPAAIFGGEVGDTYALDIRVLSDDDDFNGVYVTGGNSQFTLLGSTMRLSGDGSNDFEGRGAGAMVNNGGTMIIRNAKIVTHGCIRPAVTATGYSTMKVYNSLLISNGGTLPDDYEPVIGPGMMEPPSGLGISGNSRATLTMNNSESYFYDTTIIADGWGALSTDMAQGYVYLEANHCNVQVRNPGYGLYSDIGCIDVINDSKFNVASHIGILAGNGEVYLNNIKATSGKYGVMMHCVMGNVSEVGTLEINGGRIITCDAAVYVKSTNADITIADVKKLYSVHGALIKSVINDDEYRTQVDGAAVYGVHATLKNERLKGDIVHNDYERPMVLTLKNTTLMGSITATDEVDPTYTYDKSVYLSFDDGSKWIATADSEVTLLGDATVAEASQYPWAGRFSGLFSQGNIDAQSGVTITATAGQGCLLSGTYELASGGTLIVR